MNTTFTTKSGMTFTANETMTHCYCWPEGCKGERIRIKKSQFEQAQREEAYFAAKEAAITPEDIENDARELEAYIARPEATGTDLEVPAVINQYGCVDCTKCNVQNCVHRDCMRRNPRSEGGLAECPRLSIEQIVADTEESNTDEALAELAAEMDLPGVWAEDDRKEAQDKKEREKKIRKERKAKAAKKNAAFTYTINGEVIVTLTEKQVDFVKHLPDTYFWEDGLDSCIWVDCLCDDIGGQFAGKPMTVGAMVSTLCEKGLAVRSKNRVNGKKCTGFALTPLGKQVFAGPEWGLN